MAALVASPLASPLHSPRCEYSVPSCLHSGLLKKSLTLLVDPEFPTRQTETAALVDGLLSAWSEQQSRSPNLEHSLHFSEPTSFPFPVFCDPIQNVPEIPKSTIPLGTDFSTYTSCDFESLFDNYDLASLCPDNGQSSSFDDADATQVFRDCMSTTELLIPGEYVLEDRVARVGDSSTEDVHIAVPVTEEDIFHIGQESSSLTEITSQYILSEEETPKSNILSKAETPLGWATQTPFPFSPARNHDSSTTPLVSTPSTFSTGFDGTVSFPVDRHYLDVSSRRKRQKIDELQHVSSPTPSPCKR